MTQTLYVLTGPTASGKTEAGGCLAAMMGAEIISVDSMNVYRGMDIGTAKPPRHIREQVPHHLVDVVDPSEAFNVARYVSLARQAIQDISARGRAPLCVGGTPMYLRALLSGLFDGPSADWDLRQELYRLGAAGEEGAQALHARLAAVDPVAAGRLHPRDVKRVVRALEVHAKTGVPISQLQHQWGSRLPSLRGARLLALARQREDLRARIHRRVEEMFARGLVEEVRGLLRRAGGMSRTARAAVGYAEVIAHIEEGMPLGEAVERVKKHTWRVARKQMTWLRHFPGVWCVDVSPDESAENLAQSLYKLIESWHNRAAMVGGCSAAG
jgi:tRNA dimethylallyltransferase